MSAFLVFIGLAVFVDIVFNDGDTIIRIIRAFHGKKGN